MSDTVTFACDDLEKLIFDAMTASKTGEKQARSVARALLAAEIDGRKGHGFSRVPSYAGQAISGKVDGMAEARVVKDLPGALTIDVRNGFFFPAFDMALPLAVKKARTNGISGVAFMQSHHCGVLGHHVERAAEAGMISMLVANSPEAMAPWGGNRRIYGTQPIAFGAPRKSGLPLVIDLALSQVARGNILTAKQAGKPIPEGWATDGQGRPTTDAEIALTEGMLLPMGGAKGAALALLVEVLAGPLTGAALSAEASSFFTTEGKPPAVGQYFIVIDPDAFSGREHFLNRIEVIMESIASQEGARIPGSRREALRKKAEKEGLNVPKALVEEARALAKG